MRIQMVSCGWVGKRAFGVKVKVLLVRKMSGFILIRPITMSNLDCLTRLFLQFTSGPMVPFGWVARLVVWLNINPVAIHPRLKFSQLMGTLMSHYRKIM